MAEVTQANATQEIRRRQQMKESLETRQHADKLHRANLGLPSVDDAPKRPRHVELAPQVATELAGKSAEEFAAMRREGKLPDCVKEAMDVIPTPARDQLQLAEFTNCDRRLIAPADVHPMLLDNNRVFWSSISDQLQVYDLIRTIAPDRTWYAEYVVTHCSENEAEARLLRYIHIDPPQVSARYDWLPVTHELIAVGPESAMPGFSIRRVADGRLMNSQPFKEIEDARRYWKDHAINRRDEQPQYFP